MSLIPVSVIVTLVVEGVFDHILVVVAVVGWVVVVVVATMAAEWYLI